MVPPASVDPWDTRRWPMAAGPSVIHSPSQRWNELGGSALHSLQLFNILSQVWSPKLHSIFQTTAGVMTSESTDPSVPGPGGDGGSLLQPGQVIRPVVRPKQIPALVKRIFGLNVTSVKELNSYDDKNFHIQVTQPVDNPHLETICLDGYVLKILNSMDSQNQGIVAAQNQMMVFLAGRGFNVPWPEKNLDGSLMILTQVDPEEDAFIENNVSVEARKREHIVRLLTYLPGKILHQVLYTSDLFFESGSYIARMNDQLKDFDNEQLKSRKLVWMLESTPHLSKFTYVLESEEKRQLIQEVLDAWDKKVIPVIPELEKGFIHGDINDQNIIVQPDDDDPTLHHIHGLLDFGDIQYSCYIFELAITIMYQMVEVKVMPAVDVGGHIIAGYLAHRKVPQQEWDILKECVAARFAQSLVLGAYSHQQDPANKYLLITASGWSVFRHFWYTPQQEVVTRWKEIIQSYQK